MANETEDVVNDNKGKDNAAAAATAESNDKDDSDMKKDENNEYKSNSEKGQANKDIEKCDKQDEEKKDSHESKNVSNETKEKKSNKGEVGEEKEDSEITKEKLNDKEKENVKESMQPSNDTKENLKTEPNKYVDAINEEVSDKKKEENKIKEEEKKISDTNTKDNGENNKDISKDKTKVSTNVGDNDVKKEKNIETTIIEKDSIKETENEKKKEASDSEESLEEKSDSKDSKKEEEKHTSKESDKDDTKGETKNTNGYNEEKNKDQKAKDINKDSDKNKEDVTKDSNRENARKENIQKNDKKVLKNGDVIKEDTKENDIKKENTKEADIKSEDKKVDDKIKEDFKNNDSKKQDTINENTKNYDPKRQETSKDVQKDVKKEKINTKYTKTEEKKEDTKIGDVSKKDKIKEDVVKTDEKIDTSKDDPKKESEKIEEIQKDTKAEIKKEDKKEALNDKVETDTTKPETIKNEKVSPKDNLVDTIKEENKDTYEEIENISKELDEDKAPLLGKENKAQIVSDKKTTKSMYEEEKKTDKKKSSKEIDDDKKPLIDNEDKTTAENILVLPNKEESRDQATAAPIETKIVEDKSKIANGDKKPESEVQVDIEADGTKDSKSETAASGNVVINPMPPGLNARLGFAIAAAALGSAFLHGFNLGVINAPLDKMGNWLNETNNNRTGEYLDKTGETLIISWVVSIYCVGGMIGGSATGFFSERFGRKGALLINNIFAIIAAILFGFCKMANSWEMIVAARFFIGINNGLNAGLCPMYLSEIAPTSLRGSIGTVYQLVVTISILFSQIMGLEEILGTADLWPILLSLTAIPAIFQLVTLPICPESPKFLLIVKEEQVAAQRALTWLRDSSNVHDEMEEMRSEAEAGKLVPTVSLREIITNPTLRIPLIISVMMMLAQQLSGINAVIFFSSKIYESAGLSQSASINATIAMGAMNVAMTVISLVMVERAGRKTLMLVGMIGMMIVCILLTLCLLFKDEAQWISYLSIVLVILFVVMFATGPGSIPWFLVTEVFAQNARPMASSIAVAVNWTAAFVVGLGFLPIAQLLGPYVFIIFVVLLAFFTVFTWFKVPETKGKSIDEITAMFKQQAYGGNSV